MLRRFVNWILVLLHLRDRKEERPALQQLLDLVPVIFTAVILIGFFNSLPKPEPIELAWYRKLLQWFRRLSLKLFRRINYWHAVVIGY